MIAIDFRSTLAVESLEKAYLDARQVLVPTRSKATTLGEFPFSELGSWIKAGNVTIQLAENEDPAINNFVQLESGPNLQTPTFIQRKLPSIPANFGICSLLALPAIGPTLADAVLYQIQKTVNNKNVMLKFCQLGVFVFVSGGWKQLSTYSNTSFCEWWIEVREESGVDHVSAYAGTQFVGEQVGILPDGPTNNSGLVYLGQESQITPNRISRIAYLGVGQTQLCDLLILTLAPVIFPYSSNTLTVRTWIEDVSATLLETDIALELKVGNGEFISLPLQLLDSLDRGVIDSTKTVKLARANSLQPVELDQPIQVRLRILSQKFVAIHGAVLFASSTM